MTRPLPPTSLRSLLWLALPAAASAILNNAFRVIDQYAVQWIGTAAQAAIGSSTFVLILFYSVFTVVSGGAGPLVARATGAGDEARRRRLFGAALSLQLLVAAGTMVAGGLGAEGIASLIGLEGEAHRELTVYLRWICLAGLPLTLGPLVDACFIALGRTGTMMRLQVVATGLNGLLNWLLIYELGLGIQGAALASGISRGVSVLVGLVLLWREIRWSLVDLHLPGPVRQIVAIGLPVGANVAAYALVYWALLRWAISPLGPEVNAALGIGFSALEGFTWPLFHGISLGVSSLVGRQLGAGQQEEARRTVRLGLPLSSGAGIAAALAFWFGAEPLCGAFTQDPAVLEQAVLYARVLAFSQLFVAWEALAEGTLSGAGDTRTVLLWSAPLNVLRVPLGWALAGPFGWGAAGVWWAINLTTLVKALGKGGAVARGRWSQMDVDLG